MARAGETAGQPVRYHWTARRRGTTEARRHPRPGRLTASELRVAQLAAGQTNRQIAQALFVTRRAVETHLTSSYEKLGILRADLSSPPR